jgi:hypothetical protein
MMMKNKLRNEIHNFIINWNEKFPIDYWWRKKYNIPFGSIKHRNATFIDMFIDYEEDKLMNNLFNNTKDIKNESELSNEEIDNLFDNLDISQFNSKK